MAFCSKGYCFTLELISRVIATTILSWTMISALFYYLSIYEVMALVHVEPHRRTLHSTKKKCASGMIKLENMIGIRLATFSLDPHWRLIESENGLELPLRMELAYGANLAILSDRSLQFFDDYSHHINGLISYRSWAPIFFWLLDATLINAYIYHQNVCPRAGKTPLNHRAFRLELAWQPFHPSDCVEEEKVHLMHFPLFQEQRVQLKHRIKTGARRQTTEICAACKVPLCASSKRNCCAEYHNQVATL
ncbi:hypothetical protein GN958_ATG22632 [Phytophthora infestans]|uniref:PiggyBac transposable element-derived protein domain-containing protein n=1 Tax=Phytophthora infestans TaxID=4787 RepID=A0A8S9TKP8_PHYIN|nr:hypothetical protein GN958_ATG22632 [Phytophthora infestans]